ncbi:MAG: carbohydrate binding domain-containing protein [Isosphaeraceae bacterium]|nr:carbohydrate binding domain-containing protein [Isosphaeraceae bacterium]
MNRLHQCRCFALGVGIGLLCGMPAARGAEPGETSLFPFVLPWDDDRLGVTNVSGWLDRPAGGRGPVVVKDGHLFTGNERLRLLGVNLCFGANFPRHGDATKIAARLAKFGVNAVRFHHMDMQVTPNGIFAVDGRTLDTEQLDRLDFLVARLKEHGIYADLNLHVSRTYPDLPAWEGMPSFHKGVDQFFPRMIEWQREYARALLTHTNPYTKTRYADEPAVALVEINNENGLFHEWWDGGFDEMPAIYADELGRQWNEWLAARHPDFTALKKAWGVRSEPLGHELLVNPDFAHGLDGWNLEQHGDAQAGARTAPDAPGGAPALRVDVARVDGVGWHVQLNQPKLSFARDTPFTVRFQAKSDGPRRVLVSAMQNHAPWKVLWFGEASLSQNWKPFQFTFQPDVEDGNARLTLSQLGERTGPIWVSAMSLKPGGVSGLAENERAGHVAIFRKRDYASRTPEARRDWVRFLCDTEERYWTGMARFLKDDLKVKSLLVGTQTNWSPATIQSRLDVIDSHAYWQHPHFPGRSWDPENWTVQNVPMAGRPDGGTLPGLAIGRVAGKPFLCTEYNHSAPNTYSAETLPLIAAFAALQDWDGVFAFAYSHRKDDWDARRITSFFDIDQHPLKMATLPAATALFLRGDVRPFPAQTCVPVASAAAIERASVAGSFLGADAFGVDRQDALQRRVALDLRSSGEKTAATAPADWTWGLPDGRKTVLIDTPRSKAVIGEFTGAPFLIGGVRIEPGPTRQGWAVLTVTARDGADFKAPGRLLLTATGMAENTGMRWKNADKTTVGQDWGNAPSLVEGVAAAITLPVSPDGVRAWALDTRGLRGAPLVVKGTMGRATITIGPQFQTVWYEIEIPQGR